MQFQRVDLSYLGLRYIFRRCLSFFSVLILTSNDSTFCYILKIWAVLIKLLRCLQSIYFETFALFQIGFSPFQFWYALRGTAHLRECTFVIPERFFTFSGVRLLVRFAQLLVQMLPCLLWYVVGLLLGKGVEMGHKYEVVLCFIGSFFVLARLEC